VVEATPSPNSRPAKAGILLRVTEAGWSNGSRLTAGARDHQFERGTGSEGVVALKRR